VWVVSSFEYLRERGREALQGNNLLLPLFVARLGEKEDVQCRSKQHCFELGVCVCVCVCVYITMNETTSFI